MTLGLFNGTGKRHNDPTLEGVKGLWVSRRMWWDYFTYELTTGQQTGRINGYSAFLPKWVRLAGQSARAAWEERRQDAPFRVWDESVTLTSNFLNAERADLWERLASCPDLMVLLCDANGRFWLIGEDVGLRTTWSGKTSNVQGYEVEITGQQRWATREVEGTTAVMMIQSDPTSVSPEYVTRIDAADLEYLNVDTGECVVLGPTPLTFCCNGGGGGITQSEVQALIDAALASLSAADIVFTPTGGITATNVQAAIAQVDSANSVLSTRLSDVTMPLAVNVPFFDGVNDELTRTGLGALPNEMTIAGWFKRGGTGVVGMFRTGTGTDGGLSVYWDTSLGLAAAINTNLGGNVANIFQSTGATLAGFGPGEWTHVAVRWRRIATNSLELWVNGMLYASTTGYSTTNQPTNYGTLSFGRGQLNAGTFLFSGWQSNWAIWHRLLTRDEIQGLARRGRREVYPTSSLIAHWPMDASLTNDVSGSGNNLTAVGGIGLVPMN